MYSNENEMITESHTELSLIIVVIYIIFLSSSIISLIISNQVSSNSKIYFTIQCTMHNETRNDDSGTNV